MSGGYPMTHLRAMVDRTPLSDWLLYGYATDDGMVLTRDNMIGCVIECAPLTGAGEDTEKVLRGIFEAALPPYSAIQISLYASEQIEPVLRRYTALRLKGTLAETAAHERANLFRQSLSSSLTKSTTLRPRHFRVFISLKIPAGTTPKSIKEATTKLGQLRDTIGQACKSLPTPIRYLDMTEILALLRELLNPGHDTLDDSIHPPGPHPMNKEIVYPDTLCRLTEKAIYLDGRIVKSLTPKQYPETWHLHEMNGLIGDLYQSSKQISVPFLLTLNAITLPQDDLRHSIRAKASIISNQAQGPLARMIPRLLVRRESLDMMLMSFEHGLGGIAAYLHLLLFAHDSQEATTAESAATSLWATRNYVLKDDPYIGFPLMLQSLPLGLLTDKKIAWEFGRAKTMHTGNTATLAPMLADWSGTGTPTLLLTSRRGQVMPIDLFDNKMGNYNCCVAAASGSGKSFLINDLISAYHGQGAHVWVIDVGRSYLKLCQRFGGQFIEFSSQSNISLNPFSRITDFNDSVDMLKSVIAQMARPTQPITDLQKATLERALTDAWEEHGQALTITKLVRVLQQMSDPVADELAKSLFAYTKDGPYSQWFEPPANIDFSHFAVLELEELKSKKELQSVVLLLLIFQIQHAMYLGDRETKKIVVIDEAWELIRGGNTAAFIESGYRRFRKYKGAAITITQGINDLYQAGAAGQAIIDNSDWLFLLRQKPESIQALKANNRLPVDASLEKDLMSVHTVAGEYSEIYVVSQMGSGVGRLIVERYTQLVYTTDPFDLAEIEAYLRAGATPDEAIRAVLAKRYGERAA